MVGGYGSWELIPNGARIAPANQKTQSITMPATTLNAYKPDGNFDLYQPQANIDYTAGEVVVLTGKCRKHNDHWPFIWPEHFAFRAKQRCYLSAGSTE